MPHLAGMPCHSTDWDLAYERCGGAEGPIEAPQGCTRVVRHSGTRRDPQTLLQGCATLPTGAALSTVLHSCAGFAPGTAGPCRTCRRCCKAMQDLQMVLQHCAALAPSPAGLCSTTTQHCRTCRTTIQHCRTTHDLQPVLQCHAGPASTMLQDHAGFILGTARPCSTCTQYCRAMQYLQPALQGCARLACDTEGLYRTRM